MCVDASAFVTAAPASSVPNPSSVDQTPCADAVLVMIDATDDALSSGFAAQTSAAAPATSGAEYEVPDPSAVAGRAGCKREEGVRGARCDGAEHADPGCEQVDVAAGGGEARARPGRCRGADDEAVPAEQRRRVRGAVAALAAVTRGSDEQHALLRRVPDRRALGGRGLRAAQAQVDDARAVVDGPDDAGGLVDVGERRAAVRLHDHQVRLAAEAGGERRDEGSMTDRVVDALEPLVTL